MQPLVLPLVLTLMMMMRSSDAEEVHIWNQLRGWSFTIHCRSGSDDLGEHTVDDGGDYWWSFEPNIFGTTLFYCDISWGGHRFSFDAYDASKGDWRRCTPKDGKLLCRWVNNRYALYNWNEKRGVWEIMHFWES